MAKEQEMQCPRCDGQGDVQVVRVNATGLVLQVCDECEATWLENEEPSLLTFRDFETYMRSFGLEGLWSEVTVVSKHDQT